MGHYLVGSRAEEGRATHEAAVGEGIHVACCDWGILVVLAGETDMAVAADDAAAWVRHGEDGWVDHPCEWVAAADQRLVEHLDH